MRHPPLYRKKFQVKIETPTRFKEKKWEKKSRIKFIYNYEKKYSINIVFKIR